MADVYLRNSGHTFECYLLCRCYKIQIDGTLELVPRVIFPLQFPKFSVMLPEYLQVISHIENAQLGRGNKLDLFLVMEVLNRIRNEIQFRDLVILEDVIVSSLDEFSCLLILAFVGIRTATSSEEENVSSAFGMRPRSRSSR